jgi:hypothetical protein
MEMNEGAAFGRDGFLGLVVLALCVVVFFVSSWFARDKALREVDSFWKMDMVDEEMLSEMPVPVLIRSSFELQRQADERWMEQRREVMERYPWLPPVD